MTATSQIKKHKKRIIQAADLFCGAGGTSSGFVEAVQSLGYDFDLTAVNHWDIAIQTHTRNHSAAKHLCQSIDTINPQEVIPGGRLNILMASPECTDHSNAKGGKPRSDQKRADAWLLMRWIEKLYVENLIIENVKEFVNWGPLNAKGLPDKRYRGQYFKQFLDALRINYSAEWTILNAADYGDATTRERFFLIAKRGRGKKIVFPAPTHASRKVLAKEQPSLLNAGRELKPWRPAREIIDWQLEGKSVFNRRKPLSENTMRRIFAGLFKYSLAPFVMGTGGPTGQQTPRSVDEPMRTIMTNPRLNLFTPYLINLKNAERRDRSVDEPTFAQTTGNHQAVVEPYLINLKATERRDRSIDEPIPTLTAQGQMGVAQPFLVNYKAKALQDRAIDEPLFGQTTETHQYVAEPFIVNLSHTRNNDSAMCFDSADPLKTICGKAMLALIEPFLVKFYGGQSAASVDDPIPTITANYEHYGVAEPYLLKYYGNEDGANSVENPLSTVTTKDKFGVAEPFIIPCNHGTDTRAHSVEEPMKTITQVDAWGMIEPFIIPAAYGAKSSKGDERCNSVDDPLGTVTGVNNWACVEPFLVKLADKTFHHEIGGEPVTIVKKDRLALCIPSLGIIVDINFRMLQPHELAAAMGFPKSYSFAGTRDQKVRQIGNAVPVNLAKALVKTVLEA